MLYKIGEVSKMLGISAESIRYYERQGGVKSKHVDQESGYRYYSALDVYALMRLRMYRNCGFSVQQGAELINNCTLGEMADYIVEKQADVRRTIEWNQRLLTAMDNMAETYRTAAGMLGQCRVENSPEMYRFLILRRGEFVADPGVLAQMTKWVEFMPLVSTASCFWKEGILSGSADYGIALCVAAEDAAFVGVDEVEIPLEHLPSVPSVYTVIAADSGEQLNGKMLAHALEYMNAHGMELAGDAVAKTVSTLFHGTLHQRVHEIWLPYK